MWTVIWTILLVLGGLALALLLVMVFVFTLGQGSVNYVLHLTLRDAAGQPLAYQPVLVWRHEYPRQELRTDAAGSLVVQGCEDFSTSGLVGPRRPDIFPIRLAFAGLSPLFYLFEVKRTGPVPYDVFNTERDNIFGGHWVGTFDATGHRVRRARITDTAGNAYPVAFPTGGHTLRWRTAATLRRLPQPPDTRRSYRIDLLLQQDGTEAARDIPGGTPS